MKNINSFSKIKSPAARLSERKEIIFTADTLSKAESAAANFLSDIVPQLDEIEIKRHIEIGYIDLEDKFMPSDVALFVARANGQLKKEYTNIVGLLMPYMLEWTRN